MSIYYNTEKLSRTEESEKNNAIYAKDIFENLQKKLLKEGQGKNAKQDGNSPATDKMFIFCVKNVNDSLKRKKVMESIETLESQSIGIEYDDKEISEYFANLAGLGSLAKMYRENY